MIANVPDLFDAVFFRDHWRRQHRVWPRAVDPRVCDVAGLQNLLAQHLIPRKNLAVLRDGDSLYGWSKMPRRPWDVGRDLESVEFSHATLRRLISEGASLKVHYLCDYHPPTRELACMLGERFNSYVTVNAYFTPARAAGLSAHFDFYDVLVMQPAGAKVWELGAVPAGFDDRLYDHQTQFSFEPEWHTKIRLEAGDVLYLPAGTAHRAVAGDADSLHLTGSLHQPKLKDVLETLFAQDEALGRFAHRPLYAEDELDSAAVEAFLVQLRLSLTPERAMHAFRDVSNTLRRAPRSGPLPLADEGIPPFTCHEENGQSVLRIQGQRLVTPLSVEAVQVLLGKGHLDVPTVMERFPGVEAELVKLVRQLRRLGLIPA